MTCLPLYMPQEGQTRWETLRLLQSGHCAVRIVDLAVCAMRLFWRARERRLFGSGGIF